MKIDQKRFTEIFDNAAKARVAVLGDPMLDVYVFGSASRLSQEAPVPVLRVKRAESRLGGAANVMRNLTSLGVGKVYAFGVIGADVRGQELRRLLEEGGVNTSGLICSTERQTTVKQRVIAANQQVVRMDYEDTTEVSTELRDLLADKIIAMIRAGELDAVLLEDYAKGLLDHDMLQRIVDVANQYGVFTSLDPHPGHDIRVKGISLMTPNRSEAFGLAGIYCTDPVKVVEQDQPLRKVAIEVTKNWEPVSLLVTLGDQGMALFRKDDPNKLFVIPTVAREVFDVSGAGDTVIATYTLCHAAGATDEESAVISNQAAGIVVGKSGTAVTNRRELCESFGFVE